ncbi:hypothetical protein JVU11DRAFT_11094 [Chiua virens]|nr:hypothetical protein JVU11DRAFT_11094 [Chiua virens]
MSRKRKKADVVAPTATHDAGVTAETVPQQSIEGPVVKTGACAKCRSSKVKCSFASGASACQRCTDRGLLCVAQEIHACPTRSTSAAPELPRSADQPDVTQHQLRSRKQACQPKAAQVIAQPLPPSPSLDSPKPATKRQRYYSQPPDDNVDASSGGLSSIPPDEPPSPSLPYDPMFNSLNLNLNPILEADEEMGFTIPDDSDLRSEAGELLSALQLSAAVADDDSEVDLNASDSEDFGRRIDAVGNSDADDMLSSESESAHDALELKLQRTLARTKPAPKTNRNTTQPKGKGKATASVPLSTSHGRTTTTGTYDPKTCSFEIRCAIRHSDGSPNSPFVLKNDSSLKDIREIIAEKLNRFPTQIRLQYWLSTEKRHEGLTSLQSDEELKLFMESMRDHFVPRCLQNGKPSARQLKKITVYFEDAASESLNEPPKVGNGKKGAVGMARTGASKQGSGKQTQKPTSGGNQLEGPAEEKEIIAELEARWRCNYHSQGKDDAYCYPAPTGRPGHCYVITYSNLSIWAYEIIGKRATVDAKPDVVTLRNMRTQTRHSGRSMSQPLDSEMPHPQAGGPQVGYGGYGYTPHPAWFMPPQAWGMHGHAGHPSGPGLAVNTPNTLFPPGTSAGSGECTPSPSKPSPGPSPTALPSALSKTSSQASGSPLLSFDDMDAPDIISWFKSLDCHPKRKRNNLSYAPFGPVLQKKGFEFLFQLDQKYIPLKDLQDLLTIEVGTAILIMQYASWDLAALRAGKLMLAGQT